MKITQTTSSHIIPPQTFGLLPSTGNSYLNLFNEVLPLSRFVCLYGSLKASLLMMLVYRCLGSPLVDDQYNVCLYTVYVGSLRAGAIESRHSAPIVVPNVDLINFTVNPQPLMLNHLRQ